ncbi:MAG: hypothetical protein RL220_1405 [Bacteroidota bacterium]
MKALPGSFQRPFTWFVFLFSILAVAYYMLEWHNGRNQMADFRVYYDACRQLISGEEVYGNAYGVSSGFYKYSPFALIPFIPFALLPYPIASALYYVVVMVLFALVMRYIVVSLPGVSEDSRSSKAAWWLLLTSLFAADHIERELHLGNVNLFLLVLVFVMMRFLVQANPWKSAAVLALLMLFKPHFLILYPLLFWRCEWKVIVISALFIGLGLFIPSIVLGWERNTELLQAWFSAIREHNGTLSESPNTIYGLLWRFSGGLISGNIALILGLGLAGGMVFLFLLQTRRFPSAWRWFFEMFVLVALIPSLTHTDTEHFIWSLPLIGLILYLTIGYTFRNRWAVAVLMSIAFVPYVLNSPDIVGDRIRFAFDEQGGIGIANLIFVTTAAFLMARIQGILKAGSEKVI